MFYLLIWLVMGFCGLMIMFRKVDDKFTTWNDLMIGVTCVCLGFITLLASFMFIVFDYLDEIGNKKLPWIKE